ncbi:hypothetical protein ES705_10345 [subsurface metagenome]
MKGQIILRNLQWSGRHNPGFPPGSTQTAVAELLNPTSSILPYSGRLCLDKPAVVCTGTKYFNIDAGATKDVKFPILMPIEEGTYGVYLSIFHNDELLEEYRPDEDVVIGIIKYTLDIAIEPPGAGYVTKSPSKTAYPAGEVVTLTAHPYSGYEFDHWGGWPPYLGVGSTSSTLELPMTDDWWVVAAFREVAPPPVGIALKEGYNLVGYTGKAQSVSAAFASIEPYLAVVYYYNNATGLYEIPKTMVPYAVYWIAVTRNCTWTYGAEATPPTSAQLYTGWNSVCYCGPSQSVEKAVSSITDYILILYYFDNVSKSYVTPRSSDLMLPNRVCVLKVDRNCVWTFVAPEVVTGFSLSLMNILPTLVKWNANFAERSFDYEPMADSGWLAWNETWHYPSDPLGCTTLRVWGLDAQDNILFDVGKKGPIYANRKYAFNCQTLKLWDVTEYPGEIVG